MRNDQFEYRDLRINPDQATAVQSVDISLAVTNAGTVEGDEVIQLYIHDGFASTPRPVKELKGYLRPILQPGESKFITFHLSMDQLAFYDNELNLVLEPGRIYLMLSSSSDDIRLKGEFTITSPQKMAIKERVFVCPVEFGSHPAITG